MFIAIFFFPPSHPQYATKLQFFWRLHLRESNQCLTMGGVRKALTVTGLAGSASPGSDRGRIGPGRAQSDPVGPRHIVTFESRPIRVTSRCRAVYTDNAEARRGPGGSRREPEGPGGSRRDPMLLTWLRPPRGSMASSRGTFPARTGSLRLDSASSP